MEKFKVGDKIRIVHEGQKEDQICTILDILEDYGGDSFIFGRGGEEAEFLKSHKIKFEIIPGITSGNAKIKEPKNLYNRS